MQPNTTNPAFARRARFRRADSLLSTQIRKVGEKRGFAVTRLLTHWEEIVGSDIAAIARPVKVSYGHKSGLGATLTILTTGANGPMLEMQKDRIRERVNACYGYAAIARVLLTQTAPTGFAEGAAEFQHRPQAAPKLPAKTPEIEARARDMAQDVHDEGLRAALQSLGESILSKRSDKEI